MNPLSWNREYKAALGIAVTFGALAGAFLGYVLRTLGQGLEGGHFLRYVQMWWEGDLTDLVLWVAFGAAFGAAVIFIKRLTRNSN